MENKKITWAEISDPNQWEVDISVLLYIALDDLLLQIKARSIGPDTLDFTKAEHAIKEAQKLKD